MSAFLDHLAGKARGVPPVGAAQPSLPSRFAGPHSWRVEGAEPPEETPPSSAIEAMECQTGAIRTEAAGAMPRSAMTGRTTAETSPAPPIAPTRPLAMAARPVPPPSQRAATVPPVEVSIQTMPPATGITGRDRLPSALPASAPAPASASAATVQMPLTPRPVTPPSIVSAPTPPAAPGRPPAAPLTGAALAGRARTTPEPAPTIHLTIDRIDVRVPAAPARPAAPERRPRAQPSVPLADYLAANLRGRG